MGIVEIVKRMFGICRTQPPADPGCWRVVDGNVEIELSRAPELQDRNGAIRLEGAAIRERILVFRGDDDQLHALPNRCTHVGHRRLDPLPGQSGVQCCSVGRSVFDYAGKRISGSAQDPIRPFEVVERNGTLVIALKQD